MRNRIVIFLQYLIWLVKGNSGEYYKREWLHFWNHTIPFVWVYGIRKKLGLVNLMKGYAGCTGSYKYIDGVLTKSTNEIGNVVGWDGEKLIASAVEERREARVKRNLNRLDQVVEKYAQDNKGRKLEDLKGV